MSKIKLILNNKELHFMYMNKTINKIKNVYVKEFENCYTIELDRFGIKNGLINRINKTIPYKDSDYAVAKANVEGIQQALIYAKEQGYSSVKLPKGEYSICYFPNNGIVLDNMSFDGSNSKLKVMFDSTHFNPYDSKYRTCKNPDCTNYNKNILFNDDGTCPVCGRNYVYTGVPNSTGNIITFSPWSYGKTIKNLHLIGDLYERTWTDFDKKASKFDCENGVEWTYGAHLNGINCTFENIEAEGFMGDGLTSSNGSRFGYSDYAFPIINDQPNGQSYWGKLYYTLGGLDNTGNEIDNTEEQINNNTKMLRTALLTINQNSYSKEEVPYVMCLRGGGYNRLPQLKDQHFYMYFYDEQQNLIEIIDVEAWNNFNFPPNAKYIRGLLKNQSKDTFEWLLSFEITHDCKMINCYSHDNHRGGVTGAGVNYTFHNVRIINNGKSTDGSPIFPDTTRYGYNQEDSYSYKTTFKKCVIDSTFNGILLGLYRVILDECTTENTDYSSIVLYGIRQADIVNSTFKNGKIAFNDDNVGIYPRTINITNNNFYNTNIGLNAIENINIKNNKFYGSSNIKSKTINYNTFDGINYDNPNVGINDFIECKYNKFINYNNVNLNTSNTDIAFKDNTIDTTKLINLSDNAFIRNCNINNVGEIKLLNRSNLIDNNKISNTTLAMCTIINTTDFSGFNDVITNNTEFTNCTIGCYYNQESDCTVKIIFNDCIFNDSLTLKKLQFGGKFTVECNNCTFNLDNLDNGYYLICNNCTFKKPLPNTTNVTIN